MGHKLSKGHTRNIDIIPQGRFSISEEAPPSYIARDENASPGVNRVESATEMTHVSVIQSGTTGTSDARRGSQQDVRRPSLYSTIDVGPQLDLYLNTIIGRQRPSRPSLEVLRKPFDDGDTASNAEGSGNGSLPGIPDEEGNVEGAKKAKPPVRFGWVTGVMIRCMLNIWGVVLFLRLSTITSSVGIILTWVIILLSVVITSVTALSVSAIATNGRVKSGGAYFMISRTLGPEVGGPIGMVFSFANAIACSLNTVGFAETVQKLLEENYVTMVDKTNDVRIIGVITVTVLLFISLAGMEWESKTQIVFFLVLIVTFVNYFVGTFLPPTPLKESQGFFGYHKEILIENLLPEKGKNNIIQEFFSMFAIFFPSAIGILAGANISGDLKDPEHAIPKGTLMAILTTTASYLAISATVGSCVVRHATGNPNDSFSLANMSEVCEGVACNFGWNFRNCSHGLDCKYGLEADTGVLRMVSGFGPLIIAGIFAASLSSALAFLVSAPKVFQCLCKDNIYPYIGFFAKGYGKNDEPLRGYVLTYFIAAAFILIGDLDIVAPVISNFFLCSYALINFSCFHASTTNSPGWRPSFRYYNRWVALFGAIVSVVLMFMLTWWAALITLCLILFLFGYIIYKKPEVNWGSSVQASTYNMALSYSVSLSAVEDHVKNYRPQCLVLTGPPVVRPALVDFVGSFTKNISLMVCADILMVGSKSALTQHSADSLVKWLNRRKVRSFYTQLNGDSLREGTKTLLQSTGLGKLKPNILVMGFQTNWRGGSPYSMEDYVNTIHDTFDANYGVCILRMMDGLDMTEEMLCEDNAAFEPDESPEQQSNNDSTEDDSDHHIPSCQISTVFQSKQGKKTIDVYWISDDGGLTLLIPYLLTRRKRWRQCKVRVFVVGQQQTIEEDRKEMVCLLQRFRLDVHDVIVITDSERPPLAKSLERFENFIAPFRLKSREHEDDIIQPERTESPWRVSDKVLDALRMKSERKVRLNEIIRRNSRQAALVIVSMPVPQSDCPSSLYMAWLDALTCGLHCPVLLIRGNQQNVLTFDCQ
ncbi:solute carrier family 12 member 3-like [Sardina pilchardus]|uniref:solute carrier family 12 member 3-like n=1 Tax=Sardina pilchardus TaxID=27697 RepID=UPI002E148701